MIFDLFQRYSLKIIFVLTLLVGLQLPHFLMQYETRLDAHYLESKDQLAQYQLLADLLFEGDLNALLEKHKSSEVALFKAETKIIEKLINRTTFLATQKQHLTGSTFERLTFLSTQFNQPLFLETKQNYQANIVLNKESITVGILIALVSTLFIELLFNLLPFIAKKWLLKKTKNKPHSAN